MNHRVKPYLVMLALLYGGANFLSSCKGRMDGTIEIEDLSKVPTISSDSLTIISSKDGEIDYRFETPLLERFDLSEEPYMLFSKGIKIITFDSVQNMESSLSAQWAHFNEKKQLWEAKGNVVGVNVNGDSLFTQQIFWDQIKKRIYSNVDTKVVSGTQVVLGDSFESDENLDNIVMGRNRGRFLVDTASSDSTATETQPVDSLSSVDTNQAN